MKRRKYASHSYYLYIKIKVITRIQNIFQFKIGPAQRSNNYCMFRIVLAGDHMQLEPEIVSTFAMEKGLNISLLGNYTLQKYLR